jgi:hypothetical protein
MASALVTMSNVHPDETDPIMYQDMVDTTPFSHAEPHLRADYIIKIVLGSINSTLDHIQFPTPPILY